MTAGLPRSRLKGPGEIQALAFYVVATKNSKLD